MTLNKQTIRSVILYGLYLIPFIPFLVSSSFLFPFITTKVFAWRLIIEVIFFAWLVLALIDKNYLPKKSLILYSVGIFLAVIGLANSFGLDPETSFWSVFERMEGYVTLLHLGAFFLVITSVFEEKDWHKWWHVSLVASGIMAFYSILQLFNLFDINQGGVRVDGRLGNAAYLAVYLLFHIFIALYYLVKRWGSNFSYLYGFLILMHILILYFTATRGSILGFLVGLIVFALINIYKTKIVIFKNIGIGLIVSIGLIVGLFIVYKDANFVKNNVVLSRFTDLSVENIKTQGRAYVWPIAIEGIKDRPILGWGQENFRYVFQEHYKAEMYKFEPWFDRAHNIFLDWAITGGIIGLISYLSLYFVPIYFLLGKNKYFTELESASLVSLFVAYFIHNLFVFDNPTSYMLFFAIIAYIHSRIAEKIEWPNFAKYFYLKFAIFSVILVSFLTTIYFLNIKPIQANQNTIKAMYYVKDDPARSIGFYKKALENKTMGRQEILERMATEAVKILSSDISIEEKNEFYLFLMDEILNVSDATKKTARYQLTTGSILSSLNKNELAVDHLTRAKEIMPEKLESYFELGAVYINNKDYNKALNEFRQAYEMAPEYNEAKKIYLIGAIFAKNNSVEREMISKIDEKEFFSDPRIFSAYYLTNNLIKAREIILKRMELDPSGIDKYKKLLNELENKK